MLLVISKPKIFVNEQLFYFNL